MIGLKKASDLPQPVPAVTVSKPKVRTLIVPVALEGMR